jgi:hypothetical protein
MLTEQYDFPQDFMDILEEVYTLPASVTTISQLHSWKLGKTSFSLLLSEILLEKGIIDLVASNTETDRYPLIEDFDNFDMWLRRSGRKVFLFDEVISASPKRKAMSSINIKWLQKIGQLSKGRCALVVITQAESLTEKTFFNPIFNRGNWTKLTKTVVRFESPQLYDEPFVFEDIPMCSVKFNPYEFAKFNEHGVVKQIGTNEPLTDRQKAIVDFRSGMRPRPIGDKYHVGHETVLGWIRDEMNVLSGSPVANGKNTP